MLSPLGSLSVSLLIIIMKNRMCYEVFIAATIWPVVYWVVTPCSLVCKARNS
jgi:hypothetical protein